MEILDLRKLNRLTTDWLLFIADLLRSMVTVANWIYYNSFLLGHIQFKIEFDTSFVWNELLLKQSIGYLI